MGKKVEIYTDGSCLGNPGPGGYGAVLVYGVHTKELAAGYHNTTNNRMELAAAIISLESLLEPCDVVLTTDSKYLIDGITKWLTNWQKNNWLSSSKQPVKNKDLWQRLAVQKARHHIQWQWVKGHSGHPMNERCDELARTAAASPSVTDDGYVG